VNIWDICEGADYPRLQWQIPIGARYSGGTGEPNDPYRIANAEDLNDIGNHQRDWHKHFILINDVNLAQYTGTQFKIIGNSETKFTGVFDGNDHKVWSFTWISDGINYIGLFGYVGSGGQIKNLGMENVDVNVTTGSYVGGLVGYDSGTITNCYSSGSVTGSSWSVGGLVGYNRGTITNCYSTGSVTGGSAVGGLVGNNEYGFITASNSFWDTQTSGQSTSAGGTPKTTAEMKTKSTFTNAGWDFVNIWDICEGTNYPRLRWQIPPALSRGDFVCPYGVDFADFAVLASAWQSEPSDPDWNPACDISQPKDNFIDELDLAIFCENWLEVTTP
jgi:hypothetical protein